jgi:hypothetical protein
MSLNNQFGGQHSITPVLLIVFNRPQLTAQVMRALQVARPVHLLVAADGPRTTHPGEAELCAVTRETVRSMINWPCNVHWKCSEQNLGCGMGPASAIAWALELFEQTIILEDDCVPHQDFFPFVEAMLNRYRDNPRVILVSGINVLKGRYALPFSYGFSRYTLTWGWATWRRAWKHYDYEIKLWPAMHSAGLLLEILGERREAEYWTYNFNATELNSHDVWDYQLHLAMWAHGMYSVYPATNLITNIGVEGTHFNSARPMHNLPTAPLPAPLTHPPIVYRDTLADTIIRRTWYLPSMGDRVQNKLRRLALLFGFNMGVTR